MFFMFFATFTKVFTIIWLSFVVEVVLHEEDLSVILFTTDDDL